MPDPITIIPLEHTILKGFGEWTWSNAGSTGKRTWYLACSRQPTSDDADAVYAAVGVAVGDPLTTGDTTRYCTKITIKAIEDDLTGLYAEAEYGANQYQANPLLRPDQVSLEVAGETEDWFVDQDGKPTVNSAGEIFAKIPTRTTGGVKMVVTGNRSTIPAASLIALLRPSATNSNALTVRGVSIAAGQAKFLSASSSPQSENGVNFHTVRWEMALAPSWEIDLDDRGFNEKDTANAGKLKPIVVGSTGPAQVPYPLNGSGAKKPNVSDTPAVIHLKPYLKTNFSFGWTAAA